MRAVRRGEGGEKKRKQTRVNQTKQFACPGIICFPSNDVCVRVCVSLEVMAAEFEPTDCQKSQLQTERICAAYTRERERDCEEGGGRCKRAKYVSGAKESRCASHGSGCQMNDGWQIFYTSPNPQVMRFKDIFPLGL